LDVNDVPYLKTSTNLDFTKYTTFVTANAGTSLDYSFKPREDNKVYYVFIKARLNPSLLSPASAEASLNIFNGMPTTGTNIMSKNIKCVTDKNWQWYAIDNVSNTQIQFQTTTKGDYYLELAPLNSNLQIDKILISESPNPILDGNNISFLQNSCSLALVPISINVTNINCNGAGNTGEIKIISPIGSGWTYSKDGINFQSSPIFSNLSANTYPIKAQNSNGQYTIAKYTKIEEPKPLIVVSNNVNPKCSNSSDGRILASVSGGTPPYNYLWNNGSTNELITGLSSGIYTTTVTDNNGCTVLSNPISIIAPLPLTLNYTVTTTPSCNATNGSILISATGGTPIYEISKDATNFSAFSGNSSTTTNSLTPGSYDFYVKDYNNCTSQLSNILIGSSLQTGISSTNPLCTGSPNGSISYPASFSSVTYRKLPQTNNISYTSGDPSLSAGIYQLSFIDNGCSYKYNVTLTDPDPLTISSSVSPTSCAFNNGAIHLNLTGGVGAYNILWNTGQTSPNITSLPSAIYSVTVSDANACQMVRTYFVPNENLILNSSTKNISCYGKADGEISLLVNNNAGTLSYNWSNGSTTQNISGLIAGTYNVTVTSSLGCTGTFSTPIDISSPTNISIGSTITNINCVTPNSGTIALSAAGGAGGYSYLWNNGAISSSISNLQIGNYEVTVTDNNACTSNATLSVGPTVPITIAASNVLDETCWGENNGSISLVVTGGTAPYSYLWSNSATSQTLNNVSHGNYTVTVTDNASCTRISHTINIGVGDCCKNGLDLSFANTTGSLQLNNDFTINAGQNLTISGAVLMCASYKIIIVKAGGTLSVNSSTIQSCSNNMWGGIEAEPGSIVNIGNNSLIKDALIGINASDNSTLNTAITIGGGSTFDKNYISVSLTGGDFSYANFNGAFFKCTGALKKGPSNIVNGIYTSIHILAKNAGTINLGGINGNTFSTVFEDADICVYTEETNLNLDNCKFSIVNNNPQSSKSAVMCNSYDPNQVQPNNNFYNILVGFNSTQSGMSIKNEFNNYKIGVSVYRNCETRIMENNFYSCEEGILTKNILIRNIIISNNTFEGINKSAIEVSNCMNGSVYISGNHVNVINNGSPFNEANEANKGIWVHNHRPGYSGINITENEIWNSRFGIQITNNETGKVTNNYVYSNIMNDNVNSSIFFRRGIKLENCRGLEVITNHVARTCAGCGDNTVDLNDKLAGIHEVMGMGNKIEENEVTNIPTGISINGNCSNSQYTCNILNNGYEGFRLENGAIITDQGSATSPSGNKWLGSFVYRINNIDLALPVKWWYNDIAPEELPSGFLNGIYINPTSASSCIITNCPYCDQERLVALINDTNDSLMGNENSYFNRNFTLRSITDSLQLMYSGSVFDIPLQNFFTLYSMTNLGLINSINDALSLGDAANATTLNETLISANLIEANSRNVNAFETTFRCDTSSISDSDLVQVIPIAYQSPYFGGEAVFRMRSILGIDLNDTQLSSKFANNGITDSDMCSLFPNPNSGTFYLLSNSEINHAVLRIYNLNSQLLQTISLNNKSNTYFVSLNELPNGMYHVELISDNNMLKSWKVVIQK
jgi:SprB repeat/Secretion system C-terminal sorting domain